MSKFRVASMFAGIGGVCLGFKNAGGELVWANEIDTKASITYRENFGKNYLVEGDIREIPTEDIPDFDILTAGFPCQAFSIAGYRKGFEDDRGNLFYEVVRLIRDKQPTSFLLENVKNLVGHDKGNTFKVIQEALSAHGYYIKYKVLNSMEYGNVPQNRERIYIVGFKDENAYKNFDFPNKIPLTKTIHDIIDVKDKKDDKFYYNKTKYYDMLSDSMTNKNTVYQLRRIYVRENKSNVCPTLTANMGTGGHNVPLIIDNYDIRKLTPKECLSFQGFPDDFVLPDMGNSHIYKQAGNAVTVSVVEKIAHNIISSLKGEDCNKLKLNTTENESVSKEEVVENSDEVNQLVLF